MGKYIKTFNNHTDYQAYINSDNLLLPNVSYCKQQKETHFNTDAYWVSIEFTLQTAKSISVGTRIIYSTEFTHYYELEVGDDSFENVMQMEIDGTAISKTDLTEVTDNQTLQAFGALAYFYDFSSGHHTIKLYYETSEIAAKSAVLFGYDNTFSNNDITPLTVTISKMMKTVGSHFLFYCTLPDVYFENGIKDVSTFILSAFLGTPCFYHLYIPDSAEGDMCRVLGYANDTTIYIGNGITRIPDNCLDHYGGSLSIGTGIEYIGAKTTGGALYSLTIEAVTPPVLSEGALTNLDQDFYINVPSESVNAYKTAPVWSNFAEYISAILS